ncbi:serine/threonine-protein kinase [Acrasis kona]|uniref:Serine/threonine-protein kinase n=1 Tax=Acrasis kona TaxID=1008807 RepID=A0AAW2ZE91_9EUKA
MILRRTCNIAFLKHNRILYNRFCTLNDLITMSTVDKSEIKDRFDYLFKNIPYAALDDSMNALQTVNKQDAIIDPASWNFLYHIQKTLGVIEKREKNNQVRFPNGLVEFFLYRVGNFDVGDFEITHHKSNLNMDTYFHIHHPNYMTNCLFVVQHEKETFLKDFITNCQNIKDDCVVPVFSLYGYHATLLIVQVQDDKLCVVHKTEVENWSLMKEDQREGIFQTINWLHSFMFDDHSQEILYEKLKNDLS